MNSKRKIYISLVVSGIIVVLLIFFAILPFLKEIKKNSQEFLFQKEKLALLRKRANNLRESENIYKANKSNLDKIDTLFVNKEVPVDFIDFIEKNAIETGLKIEITSLTEPKKTKEEKEKSWPIISFRMSTVGSFSNNIRFLDKLENSPYLIEISNLNMRKLTEKDLHTKKYKDFSINDITASISINVAAKKQ